MRIVIFFAIFIFMNAAAFNTISDFHHLDHIAPLAEMLNIPLFIEEEKNFSLAQKYYPMVHSHHIPDMEYQLKSLAEKFTTFYGCNFWPSQLQYVLKYLHGKNIDLIYCAHGQSDKGYISPSLHPSTYQDCNLIYGDLMKDMLSELGIAAKIYKTGNYRLLFYRKYQPFYDAFMEREVFSHLFKDKKNLLYAPTWEDSDQSTTFFDAMQELTDTIGDQYNLIVKVHPLLEMHNPTYYYHIASLLDHRPNHVLIEDIPLIYPLLSRCDFFLGDYSSVGYDFLYFQRPMFFLLHDRLPKGRLHSCGTILKRPKELIDLLEKPHIFENAQKKLYQYAFGCHSPLGAKTNMESRLLKSSNFGFTSISYA